MNSLVMITPQIEPVEIDLSSLTVKCYSWAIPQSKIDIPVICFEGYIWKETYPYDLCFIRWRCNELLRLVRDWNAIVIDFRKLEIEHLIGAEQILSVVRRQGVVRIIVNPADFQKISGDFNQGEITDDYEQTFWELAVHFNRRNQSLEVLNLKFTPVSLQISEIHFKGYTWRLDGDDTDSGYVKFIGRYRDGSLGEKDAKFIAFKLEEFCDYVKPARLIIDLKDLDYHWGDDLSLYPPQFNKMGCPMFFLLKLNQMTAYKNSIYKTDMASDFLSIIQRL